MAKCILAELNRSRLLSLYNNSVAAGAAVEMMAVVGAAAGAVVAVRLLPIPVLAVVAVVVEQYQPLLLPQPVVAGAVVAEEQAVPNDPPLTLPCHGH
jgi:hypothetical protein